MTGLRFVAALSVVIAHGFDTIFRLEIAPLAVTEWLPRIAGLGMTLFFVLSGFVIHYNYRVAVTRGGLNGLGGFLWARFARLYPLYFFIVLLDVLVGRKLFDFMVGRGDDFIEVVQALPYYLTFTQSWIYVPYGNSSLIYVAGANSSLTWSISTEWFFYLSYPLIALLVLRARRPAVVIIAAVAWCAVWIAFVRILSHYSSLIDVWAIDHYGLLAGASNGFKDSFLRWLMYFSPYLRIGEFILGCLMAQLYLLVQDRRPSGHEQIFGRVLLALGIVSIPVVIYLMYAGRWPLIRQLDLNFGLAPSAAVILFCAARYQTLFSRFLNTRPVVALGEASYSMYLIHFLVFILAWSFLGGVLAATTGNIIFLSCRLTFLFVLIIVLSLGLHAFIEAPARRWLRGLWQKSPHAAQTGHGLLPFCKSGFSGDTCIARHADQLDDICDDRHSRALGDLWRELRCPNGKCDQSCARSLQRQAQLRIYRRRQCLGRPRLRLRKKFRRRIPMCPEQKAAHWGIAGRGWIEKSARPTVPIRGDCHRCNSGHACIRKMICRRLTATG